MYQDPVTVSRAGAYDPAEGFPAGWRGYLAGGDRPGTFTRDLGTAIDQVPRWGWATMTVVFGTFAYMAWRQDKKQRKA